MTNSIVWSKFLSLQHAIEQGAMNKWGVGELYQNGVARPDLLKFENIENSNDLKAASFLSGDGRHSFGVNQSSTNFMKAMGFTSEEIASDANLNQAYPGIDSRGGLQFNPKILEIVGLKLAKDADGNYTDVIESADVNVAQTFINRAITKDSWDSSDNALAGKSILEFAPKIIELLAPRNAADTTTGLGHALEATPEQLTAAKAYADYAGSFSAQSNYYNIYNQNPNSFTRIENEVFNKLITVEASTSNVAAWGAPQGGEKAGYFSQSSFAEIAQVQGPYAAKSLFENLLAAKDSPTHTFKGYVTGSGTEVNFKYDPQTDTFSLDKDPVNVSPTYPTVFDVGVAAYGFDTSGWKNEYVDNAGNYIVNGQNTGSAFPKIDYVGGDEVLKVDNAEGSVVKIGSENLVYDNDLESNIYQPNPENTELTIAKFDIVGNKLDIIDLSNFNNPTNIRTVETSVSDNKVQEGSAQDAFYSRYNYSTKITFESDGKTYEISIFGGSDMQMIKAEFEASLKKVVATNPADIESIKSYINSLPAEKLDANDTNFKLGEYTIPSGSASQAAWQGTNYQQPDQNVDLSGKTVIDMKWWYGGNQIVENFDLSQAVIVAPNGMNFASLTIKDTADGAFLSYKDTFDGSEKGLVLKGISASELSSDNFAKFYGSFSDASKADGGTSANQNNNQEPAATNPVTENPTQDNQDSGNNDAITNQNQSANNQQTSSENNSNSNQAANNSGSAGSATNTTSTKTETTVTNNVTQTANVNVEGGMAGSSVQSFLDTLRGFESGTSIDKTEWYLNNYKSGATVTYAKLDENGMLVDNKVIPEAGTIQTYFDKLKTSDIFEKAAQEKGIFDANNNIKPEAIDPATGLVKTELVESMKEVVHEMQYNVINPWGFVGYQLGEAVLVDAGYYEPPKAMDANGNVLHNSSGEALSKYYMWTDGTAFKPGQTEQFMKWNESYTKLVPCSQADAKFLITNTNQWEGTFTGKNGINGFQDLLKPEHQEMAIRDVMEFNLGVIKDILAKNNMTLGDVLEKEYPYTYKTSYTQEQIDDLKLRDPDAEITVGAKSSNGILETYQVEVTTTVEVTMSGILAMAHLTGAWGAADTLVTGQFRVDETGTSNLKYLYDFGGHDTIFGSDVDDVLTGSDISEKFTPGSGDNEVTTGGGSDKIIIENDGQGGGTTVVKDFNLNKDDLIFKNFGDQKAVVSQNENGDAVVTLGQNKIVLEGVTKDQLSDNLGDTLKYSNAYKIGWSGKQTISDFDPETDVIQGTSGIDFKNLKIVQEGASLKIGSIAADGGMYSYVELPGVTIDQISKEMFASVTGSFGSMSTINIEGKLSWGYWSAQPPINGFDPAVDAISSASGGMDFSQITVKDTPQGAMICYGSGTEFGMVLAGVKAAEISAKNFFGFAGKFDQVKIESNNDPIQNSSEAQNPETVTENPGQNPSDENSKDENDQNSQKEPDSQNQQESNSGQNNQTTNPQQNSNQQENSEQNSGSNQQNSAQNQQQNNQTSQNQQEASSGNSNPGNGQGEENSNSGANSQNNQPTTPVSTEGKTAIDVKWWYGSNQVIENFNPEETVITGSGGMSMSSLTMTSTPAGVLLTYGDSQNGILLKGANLADLSANNFAKFESGNFGNINKASGSLEPNSSNEQTNDSSAPNNQAPENHYSNETNNSGSNANNQTNESENNTPESRELESGGNAYKIPQYKEYNPDNTIKPDLKIDFNVSKDSIELPFLPNIYKMVQTDSGVDIQDVRWTEGSPFVKVTLNGVLAKDLSSANFGGDSNFNFKSISNYEESLSKSSNMNLSANSTEVNSNDEINDVDYSNDISQELASSSSDFDSGFDDTSHSQDQDDSSLDGPDHNSIDDHHNS